MLAGAAAGVIGARGIYELVDRLSGGHTERVATGRGPPEQHLLDGIRSSRTTASRCSCRRSTTRSSPRASGRPGRDLRDAQAQLESDAASLDADDASTPAGLGLTVSWGLPYFRRLVPVAAAKHLRSTGAPASRAPRRQAFSERPVRHRARAERRRVPARSEHESAHRRRDGGISQPSVFDLTSLRGASPAADSTAGAAAEADGDGGRRSRRRPDPGDLQLFLGFTSTQKAGMGPGRIANFETLGFVDLRDSGYFRHGTHMHLSTSSRTSRPGTSTSTSRARRRRAPRPNLNVLEAPDRSAGPADVSTDSRFGANSEATGLDRTTARRSRPPRASTRTLSGTTARPTRRARRSRSGSTSTRSTTRSPGPSHADEISRAVAGVHFVAFTPSSDYFRPDPACDGRGLPGVTIRVPAACPGCRA